MVINLKTQVGHQNILKLHPRVLESARRGIYCTGTVVKINRGLCSQEI